MALDIPNLAPNTPGEAGNLYNALSSGALENVIKGVQAQYAPLTTMSEAASKLAYSNLMGPQFLAKLMGNQDILANMTPQQRNNALQSVYGAGSGQMSGNALLSNPNMMGMLQNQQQPGFLSQIRSLMGGGQQQSNQMPMNPFAGQMQNQMPPQMQFQGMPQQQQQMQPQMQQQPPQPQNQPMASQASPTDNSFFEKAGQAAGIKEEGKSLGGIRAKAIDDLDEKYEKALITDKPIQHLMSISQDPTFTNLKNKFPLFQTMQLSAASKLGTPAEQKVIGDFLTTTQKMAASAVNDFKGRAMQKEFDFVDKMKVSPDDTINTMLGKIESIATYNEMDKQRNRFASQLIQDQHKSRGEALQLADKQIDGDAIRKQIDDRLTPSSAQGASEEKVSAGAKNLAKTMDLSHFKTPEEFKSWYAQQPEVTQQAVRLHMKQRGGGK